MTRRRPFSAVFGIPDTATARKMYGRWKAHFGDRWYGNGSRTNRAVHPSFTVQRAALVSLVFTFSLACIVSRQRPDQKRC